MGGEGQLLAPEVKGPLSNSAAPSRPPSPGQNFGGPPALPPGTKIVHLGTGQTPRVLSPVPENRPGAILISGPPPPGAKIISGPLPPGVKEMTGPPSLPVGRSVTPVGESRSIPPSMAPPNATKMQGIPPGAKIISGPPPGVKIMQGIPPGAKIIDGPPPPGSVVFNKVPSSLSIGSRPVTPEHLTTKNPAPPLTGTAPATGSGAIAPMALPPGAKFISGPPPPGAKLIKMPMSSPFRVVSPPTANQQTKTPLRLNISPPQNSAAVTPLCTPQRVTTSSSFGQPPAQAGPPPPGPDKIMNQGLPARQAAGHNEEPPTTNSLHIPRPSKFPPTDDLSFNEEATLASGDISFTQNGEVKADSTVPVDEKKRSASPSSSSMHVDPDLVTALPATLHDASFNSLRNPKDKKNDSAILSSLEEPRPLSTSKHRHRKSKEHHRRHRKNQSTSKNDAGQSSDKGSPNHMPPSSPRTHSRAAGTNPVVSEDSLKPVELTATTRSHIADQFLSILCPQQYYGKVKRINGIRPLRAIRERATGLKKHNSIYVVTKGVIPNQFFYPQLRLCEEDGKLTVDGRDRGALDTPILLYEASPGKMLFANTELEARHILETNEEADSCFVVSLSAIIFKDTEHYTLPLAMLNVRWMPYSSPLSEPQCPIHKRELQLFDPYTKELVCALCASKSDVNYSKLVVIPDVMAEGSRRHIRESITRQLDDAQHNAGMWVGQHQRLEQLKRHGKESINQQFDLVVAALESKRKEYLESCEAEFGFAQSNVAREILLLDEKTELLTAAANHLRSDSSQALYSMQIATIAEGLQASSEIPTTFSRSSLKIPIVTSGTLPNLERIVAELQTLTPTLPRPSDHCENSPFPSSRRRAEVNESVDCPRRACLSSRLSHGQRRVMVDTQWNRASRNGDANETRLTPRSMSSSVVSRSRRHLPSRSPKSSRHPRDEGPLVKRSDEVTERKLNGSINSGENLENSYAVDAVSVPNSTGTSLFDFPLHDLLVGGVGQPASGGSRRFTGRLRCVQWTIRVEDPGDWVSIGVGVGTTIDVWERGRSNDLSHLWIVPSLPCTDRPTYQVRVTVQPTVGHAKLSIHDSRGKQLDDASIPQWNAARVCYPQVTFGGRVGQVRMTQAPHLI